MAEAERLQAELPAEPHAEGVFEAAVEREGEEDALGQCDAAAVALTVAETRAVPECLTEVVALGEPEAVFVSGAMREPVAHADAVRVVGAVCEPASVPEGDFDADAERVAVAVRIGVPVGPVGEEEGEPEAVFVSGAMRESVAHADAVRVVGAVCEPASVPEGDFDADAERVAVAVRFGVPVR